ncbi:MAG: hypothetical protein ABJK37_02645 [Paraglaciecola sp.]|uniref:hypothetical protein n=1 Tax=Paraglaciecola sp. TaxID=1920173 RepID=UPI0032972EF4
MFDPLNKHKAKLQQAKTNAELANKYSKRQLVKARTQSESFISSPTGITSMFVAGAIKGATAEVPKPPASIFLSMFLKLF